MRNKLTILALAAALAIAPQLTRAADVPAAATSQTSAEQLQATITGVQGLVQVRETEDKPWKKAEVGMVLGKDAEFRTGPKSAVQFTMPPDQTVTLDRLGTVKLLQAVKTNGKIITNLGMKYGRTRYDIEAAGQEHESTISSPSSTLAVRGTKVSLYDQPPFKPQAVSLTGRASFRDGKKQLAFGNKGQGKTTLASGASSAAAFSLDQAVVDPNLQLARTSSESQIISTLLSHGSSISFDRVAGIKVVRGGFPPTDEQLVTALPGQLNFVLRWNTDADLNLSIGSPGGKNNAGELLYPVGGLNTNRSGGRTDFDHRGGPNGGIEIAYWKGNAPSGLYGIGVILASGPDTAATLDVYRGGRKVAFFDGANNVTTSNFIATAPNEFAEGTAVGIFGLNTTVPGAPSGTNEPGAPPAINSEPGAPPATTLAATAPNRSQSTVTTSATSSARTATAKVAKKR